MIPPVKFADDSDDVLVGLALPYGGPFLNKAGNPSDLYGERFTPATEMCLDWFDSRPLLYGHGLDVKTGTDVVGRVTSWRKEADGVWAEMILDRSSQYFDTLRNLIAEGKLFLSSGSMSHLVEVDRKSGDILTWPWVELSLTETPANLLATVDLETAQKHWEAAGLPVKSLLDTIKALPAEPTPVAGPDGYSPPPGSYEALTRKIDLAVRHLFCNRADPACCWDCWCYVVATFPEYAVVCCYDDGGVRYHEVSYEVGADGAIVVGESRQVQQVYLPIEPPPADLASTAMVASYTVRSATALTGRVSALHASRVKEGRVLSSANRKRVEAARDALAPALEALETLLAETEPKTEADAGTAKALVEVQAAYARCLAALAS